jgi:ribosomal protein L37E
MIFIGGVGPRKKRLDYQPRICSNCGLSQAYLTRVDHWLSVFFIPIFPVRRGQPVVLCDRCGHVDGESGKTIAEGVDLATSQCHRCGESLEKGFRYCPQCGTPL